MEGFCNNSVVNLSNTLIWLPMAAPDRQQTGAPLAASGNAPDGHAHYELMQLLSGSSPDSPLEFRLRKQVRHGGRSEIVILGKRRPHSLFERQSPRLCGTRHYLNAQAKDVRGKHP